MLKTLNIVKDIIFVIQVPENLSVSLNGLLLYMPKKIENIQITVKLLLWERF